MDNTFKDLEALSNKVEELRIRLENCSTEDHGKRYHIFMELRKVMDAYTSHILFLKDKGLQLRIPSHFLHQLDAQIADSKITADRIDLAIKTESYAMLSDLIILGQNYSD